MIEDCFRGTRKQPNWMQLNAEKFKREDILVIVTRGSMSFLSSPEIFRSVSIVQGGLKLTKRFELLITFLL